MINEETGFDDFEKSRKLTVRQEALLERWLLDEVPALTYEAARERLRREQGVSLSKGAIAAFFQRRATERMKAKAAAMEPRRKRTKGPRDLEREADYRRLLNALGRLGMNFMGRGRDLGPADLKQLTSMAMDVMSAEYQEQKLALMERKLKLAEERFKAHSERMNKIVDFP